MYKHLHPHAIDRVLIAFIIVSDSDKHYNCDDHHITTENFFMAALSALMYIEYRRGYRSCTGSGKRGEERGQAGTGLRATPA